MAGIIIYVEQPVYMHVKQAAKAYDMSVQGVYKLMAEIGKTDRYKGRAWAEINSGGDRMINTLVLEDYLRHRTELKNPCLARKLPPYDPAEARWNRGEYKVPFMGTGEKIG